MTITNALKYWKFKYNQAKDYVDEHWEASERREHREYVEALKVTIETLERYGYLEYESNAYCLGNPRFIEQGEL